MTQENKYTGFEVAIIGMACRYPGANSWQKFWDNLINEKESFRKLSDDELRNLGVDSTLFENEDYVRTIPDMINKDQFDAAFFDYTPDEAKILGPQNRIFHECVWEAFEDAGYIPDETKGLIGLYGSASTDMNWKLFTKISNIDQRVPDFILKHLSDKDFLPPMVYHKLNLRGASMNLTSACSSSLVGIHLACRALIFGEVNMAAAGGAFYTTERDYGYLYEEGSIMSKDGHCKAFDKQSSGTVAGEGAGVIVLKRLVDAIKDEDHIYAIIKGSAVNNDGNRKIGFTAPSVEGQVECIKMAQRFSKVEPSSIHFIEAHGTATRLGDSIEISALNEVFNKKNKDIAVGSVKTNIGHLDTVAGVAGVMKAALSLKYNKLPSTLHFTEPSPLVDLENGPFYVSNKAVDFSDHEQRPLRAGVNSFGVGGTNAHLILEEPPEIETGKQIVKEKILTISAKTQKSLIRYVDKLKTFVTENDQINLSNLAYTSQVGRKDFSYRVPIVFKEKEDLITALDSDKIVKKINKVNQHNDTTIFMFPGQGTQYLNMGKSLYENEPLFKEEMDKGFEVLNSITGISFKDIVYPTGDAEYDINETRYAQPIIFIFEHALAKLILSYGIKPQCMIGHSIGEYVAAALAGVFSFDDAINLLVKRGQLMFDLPKGDMLSVGLSEAQAQKYLEEGIDLATINGPEQCVFSGLSEKIDQLAAKLKKEGLLSVKLKTSHAFHSSMLDPILETFENELKKIKLNVNSIPFISNRSGKLITEAEVTSPSYWVSHMRNAVKFSNGIETLLETYKNSTFLEIGAGKVLSGLLRQHQSENVQFSFVNLIKSAKSKAEDYQYFMEGIASIWKAGLAVDWKVFNQNNPCRRISMPTYSFEPVKYATEVDPFDMITNLVLGTNGQKANSNDLIYRKSWKNSFWNPSKKQVLEDVQVLIFSDQNSVSKKLISLLKKAGTKCISVVKGDTFLEKNNEYTINPELDEDYVKLFEALKEKDYSFSTILHTWTFKSPRTNGTYPNFENLGYQSLINIARNARPLGNDNPLNLKVVTNKVFSISSEEFINPEKAMMLGAIRTIPLEFPMISCSTIDINSQTQETINSLWEELNYKSSHGDVVIRNSNRYIAESEAIEMDDQIEQTKIKNGGSYLITGAAGGMGKLLATYLSEKYAANLILISRGPEDEKFTATLKKDHNKVCYICEDIANLKSIKTKIKDANFESINGIIHAAGVADFGGIIHLRDKKEDAKIFHPKVKGIQTLVEIFENKSLDFILCCASQNAILPNPGQVADAAANNYLKAFAKRQKFNFPVISVCWETISDFGVAEKYISQLSGAEKNEFLKNCINSNEVIKIFEQTLVLNIPTPIISKQNVDFSIRETTTESNDLLSEEASLFAVEKKERPDLNSDYVAPATETEIDLAALLEEFFGFESLGLEDDIFELGADSLKVMIISKRITKKFNVEIPIQEFYEEPYIKNLAEKIKAFQLIKNIQREPKNSEALTEIVI